MQITVKVLGGSESKVEVDVRESVYQLKQRIADKFEVQADQQRLMLKGKSLPDDILVRDSGIVDGSKVVLSVRRTLANNRAAAFATVASEPPKPEKPTLSQELNKFLLNHYSDRDARLIVDEFQKDIYRIIHSLSLDEIERLAAVNLKNS